METTASLQDLSPVLVANRGEIAVRVIRTLHALGLVGVGVATEADRGSPHQLKADLCVEIDSYLDPEQLIAAAERAGARAVHPGYGFLSENPEFAGAVSAAGLTWIGPPPGAIELMGDKGRSKELAADAGVPVVPGTAGGDASAEQIAALAEEHGFPLMIKALAGGGGKGMRVVASGSELEAATAAARREAEAAFGDGRVLAERYIERPRHIEIQILADAHGNVVHLGERECSLQRRHQKVIEEAPSPYVDAAMRERMGAAAVDLARACDYEGAGTVEFIVPADRVDFFFLEMNTRLQVEHPVTEMVWGLDLIEQQLRVAAGEPLGFGAEGLEPGGHAIEARLYAEDPAAGFLPSTGTIRRWREPELAGVRIDAGVAEGSVIGTEYDPMLAKVIAHGPDRTTALGRLDRALAGLELLGTKTSAALSRALLATREVRAGDLDTGLLERRLAEEALELAAPDDLLPAGAIAVFVADTRDLSVQPGPWLRRFEGIGEVRIADGLISRGESSHCFAAEEVGDGHIAVRLDGLTRTYAFLIEDGTVWIGRDGHQIELAIEHRARAAASRPGSLEAPMPGRVLSIEVADGDRVSEGELVMVLESMKMELQITAPADGVVRELELEVGDQVSQAETLLAVVGEEEESG